MSALRKRLKRRGVEVRALEYDLIAEMRGLSQRLDLDVGRPVTTRPRTRRGRTST